MFGVYTVVVLVALVDMYAAVMEHDNLNLRPGTPSLFRFPLLVRTCGRNNLNAFLWFR